MPHNVVACATASGTMTVSWDAPWFAGSTSLTRYDVVARDASGRGSTTSLDAERTMVDVKGLTPGQTYEFSVIVVNAACASPAATSANVPM
jgi:hypothetical protein